MTDTTSTARRRDMPSVALPIFFVLTFAITWGLTGVYIVLPEWASSTFGEISGSHPFFFLATWAPAISAFALVIYYGRMAGLRGFLSRLLMWRCPLPWAVFILIGVPVVFAIGSLLKGGPLLAPVPPEGVGAMVAVLLMMLLLGPIEEFGWRGTAQPLLQRYVAPIWAGIIIGVIWGVWHFPAFFLGGTVFGGWDFLPFLIGTIALALIFTPILNRSQGSLLWPVVFHWQLINPFWPDAQPYDTWIYVAVAAVVVWWHRESMFTRKDAVTRVVP